MSDLRDLYQEVIVDHSRRPRNFLKLEGATHHADGFNPLCGDKVTIYLKVVDGVVEAVSFQGSGCAISTASASLMTEFLKGKKETDIEPMFKAFQVMVTSDPENPTVSDILGKLEIFSGVCEYPARVKCATLCWHTLNSALSGDAQEWVTTES